MRRWVLAVLLLIGFAAPAAAVSITDCNDDTVTASAANIAEPWDKNTKTFSNGLIRVALIDTGGEPVCCSMHLLVLHAVQDEGIEDRYCHIVNDHDQMGFVGIGFDKLTARYDPKKGLLITFPYSLYVDGMSDKPGVAKIRINIPDGTVKVEK
ncbi:MAG: hypothetical protein JSR60_01655 [Proteobacteria bacterium]|nr:hypothetical protein [Pseudomonadota bacterium]